MKPTAEDDGEDDQCLHHGSPPPDTRRAGDPRDYVASWTEKDCLDGKEAPAWVLILRTRGCRWARCSMCGYHGEGAPAGADDLLHQFGKAVESRKGDAIAKLYTSGSFLDPEEVPPKARNEILARCGRTFARVVVESRPEFVTAEAVSEALVACPGLEIAIGLESASPRVLSHSVRKGFSFADFEAKATLGRRLGARIRAYLLLKPPFLTEAEALNDTVASALKAAPFCDTISINPLNIQKNTLAERLWKRKLYRPPWLWTAARALLLSHEGIRGAGLPARLVSTPSGAGKMRGAHNCGMCDLGVMTALEEYSVKGNAETLQQAFSAHCSCRETWQDALDSGRFSFIPSDTLQDLRGPR